VGPEQYASVNVMSCVSPFIDIVTVFGLGVLLSVGASAGVVEVFADDSDSGTTSGEAEQPVNNSSVTKLTVMVRLFKKYSTAGLPTAQNCHQTLYPGR